MNSSNLKNTKKIKKNKDQECKCCGNDIHINDEYISVIYDDGFIKRPWGAFHLICWDVFKKNK